MAFRTSRWKPRPRTGAAHEAGVGPVWSKHHVDLSARGREKRTYQRTGAAKPRVYPSEGHMLYAVHLDLAVAAGDVLRFEEEVRLKVVAQVEGELFTFIPDFRVHFADGRVELHEWKGQATEAWKLRRKIFERVWMPQHPEIARYVVQGQGLAPRRRKNRR